MNIANLVLCALLAINHLMISMHASGIIICVYCKSQLVNDETLYLFLVSFYKKSAMK